MKIKDNQDIILLSISNEIAHIRGKEDMLHLIRNTLKKYIHFDDTFILLYNKNTKTFKSYIHHVETGRSDNPWFENQLGIEYPVVDDSVENPGVPVVQDVDLLVLHGREQVKIIHSAGIKEIVTIKLIERNELTGLFVLLSEQKNSFTNEALDLLQRISYPIAIATANIVANEDIAKKEQEKTILLSLSQEISVVRSKNDLLPILHLKLKELFPITGFGITIINEDGKSHSPFIVDSDEAVNKNSSFKEVTNKRYSVADSVFIQIINATIPLVLPVDNLVTIKGAPEYVFFWQKMGIKQVLGIPLRIGQKNLGCLIFHLSGQYKNNISANLLRGVCAQISLRLSNVIANEGVEKREKEKTILLSLSNEIASLKNRNDLYRIVNTRIKKLFSIKEFGIAQINEDKITHSSFMMDLGDSVMNHNDFAKVTTLKYSIYDTAFSSIMASDDPVILDVNQLAEEAGSPAYVHFWKAVGFRELLCLALRAGENNIGCIFFNIEANEINNLKHNLLKAVCAQLSVAISNILANEEIIKREEEKTILVSLSLEIAAVKNKNELSQLLNTKLAELFPISGFGITLLNEDSQTHSPFVADAPDELKSDADYKEVIVQKYSVNDGVFNHIIHNNGPVTLQVEELAVMAGAPAYVNFWKKMGVKQVIGAPVKAGENILGSFILLYGPRSNININNNLIKGVCSQISVAISNILANENIVRRETERELLLSLNLHIAGVQTSQELLNVINQKLKKLLGFSHTVIAVINEDKTTASVFLRDPESKSKHHPEYNKKKNYPIADGILPGVLLSPAPQVFDLTQMNKEDAMPIYFKVNLESGMEQAVMVRFAKGDRMLGVWVIIYDKKNTPDKSILSLIEGLANQVSIALSNIIANEEIREREEEKSKILSFSNSLASVKDKVMLSKILKHQLKDLFEIDDYTIHALSIDKKTYYPILYDRDAAFSKFPDFIKIINSKNEVNDGIINKVLESKEPVSFIVDDLFQLPNKPVYVNIWKEMGVKKIIGVRIRLGQENIGFIRFRQNDTTAFTIQGPLFNSICSQIAIVISNVLADDEIKGREKEKSMLLEFSNAMASVSDKKMLGRILKKQLEDLFSIDFFVIHAISKDKKQFRPIIYDPDADFVKHPDFIRRANVSHELKGSVFSTILESENPLFFSPDEQIGNLTSQPYLAFLAARGVNKIASMRIRLGQENIGILNFNQFENNQTSIQQNLFKSICSQIAINLSNIITNNEIISREQEKSLLLEFINNIAAIRDRFLLTKVLTNQLNKLFGIEDYAIHALSEDKKTHSPVMFDPDAEFAKHPVFQQMIIQPSDVMDGVFNLILNSADTVTFSINDWVNSTNPPTYTNAAVSLGIKKLTGVAIRLGDEAIAVMNFRHDESNRFIINKQLFKSICSQLAIVISNVLADDEIKGREKEKSMLLEFSNAIASVRDKNVLAKILKKQLTELFAIKDYAIHALSDDKKTHRPILYDAEADFAKHPDFIKLIEQETDVNDGIFNKILDSENPVSFNVEDWFHSPKPPVYANAARDIGLKNMAGIRIRIGDENIAVMNFRQDELNRPALEAPLFKSICSQLSITVSNIIANEKISNQLFEINKYKQQLEEEKIYLKEEIETSQNFSEMIGESAEMKKVFRLIQQVSTSDSTVLILGETGTGKELVARAIHNLSPRKNKLMVKVNCAALPANLIESELFGHERGSFTGATERRIGKFELAHQGTLFLDEIGEMPIELQVKLLRALQEKEIERVGGKITIKVDVRIITATNRNLEKLMEEGKFRSDLYYRLNIFPISLPPLRKRSEDIPSLASHFVRRFSKKTGKQINTFSNKALQEITQYNWPGNIRELEHLIERSVLLATTDTIKEIHLPVQNKNTLAAKAQQDTPIKTIDENEREYILKVLKHVKGRISGEGGAADLLAIPPSTLNSRMKRLGIRKEHFG